MRKGRLFQIICHLLEKGQSTAADMARELGVSVRTVYRDVESLNAAGIPIYAETGRNGGICLMKGFVLDRALLSKEERMEILEEIRSRQDEFSNSGPAVLGKLASLFELPAEEWLDTTLVCGDNGMAKDRFTFLQRAVLQHHCAELTYAGSGGELEKFTVMPLKLSCRANGWYLNAYCQGQEEFLQLPLSRIIKWKPNANTFEPRSFPDENPAPPRLEATRVLLRFPCELGDRVYEVFDGTLITQRKDGFLELRQDVRVDDRFIGKLLSLGPQARVVSPASLKSEVMRRAKEIYDAYK